MLGLLICTLTCMTCDSNEHASRSSYWSCSVGLPTKYQSGVVRLLTSRIIKQYNVMDQPVMDKFVRPYTIGHSVHAALSEILQLVDSQLSSSSWRSPGVTERLKKYSV